MRPCVWSRLAPGCSPLLPLPSLLPWPSWRQALALPLTTGLEAASSSEELDSRLHIAVEVCAHWPLALMSPLHAGIQPRDAKTLRPMDEVLLVQEESHLSRAQQPRFLRKKRNGQPLFWGLS